MYNLGKINKTIRMRLDNEKNQARVATLLKMTGGNEALNRTSNDKRIPEVYMDWVVDNYNHGVIPKKTLEKVLGYFDIRVEDISDDLLVSEVEQEEDLDDLIGGIDD